MMKRMPSFLSLILITLATPLALSDIAFPITTEELRERDPDTDKQTPELVRSRGYVCEEHFLKTTDGYILGLHRIVNPMMKERGRPVLLWHGLLSSSRDFIINDGKGFINDTTKATGNNLGFELAKKGYDVWLGNTRGNTYSRNHSQLDPEKGKKFWDYTYDEMIEFDVPNTIDYILSLTERKTLAYVGHSQGCMIMFGLLASFPKYNDIVKPYIALAPVTSVDHSLSPITHLAYIHPLLHIVRAYDGPFLPSNRLIRFIAKNVCGSVSNDICTSLIFLGAGFDYEQWNSTRIRTYASGFPAGTSSKNMIHFAQNVRSGIFRKFDYGRLNNFRKYGSFHSPKYRLESIKNNDIAIFSSRQDWLASPGNVDRIRKSLKVSLLDDYVVPRKWNHLDFLIGLEAGKYVNNRLIGIIDKFQNMD
jgi:lysosomal acid lipase/cholesteryl ester hydrolase